MIRKRTVFVLGAGANVPYGFSTGRELLQKAGSTEDLRALMGNAGEQITRAEAHTFRQAVLDNDNLRPSIDALMEYRGSLAKVGKRVMATLLYMEEAVAWPKPGMGDWMSLVFEAMIRGAPTLEAFSSENAVSFVTFNYDRYTENRLIRLLKSNYQIDGSAVWSKIRHMFIHVYGSLGALPEQPGENMITVPLGAPETEDTYYLGLALQQVENMIRIVHESDQSPPTFAQALMRFQTAQQCLFLGFGFGEKNIERLQPNRIARETFVDCTTYGMTAAEVQNSVYPAFPGRHLNRLHRLVREGASDERSIERFLRDIPSLLT